MNGIDGEIMAALADGPLDIGGIRERVPGYPSQRLGSHVRSLIAYGCVYVESYGGSGRVYTLDRPEAPPEAPRPLREAVRACLERSSPMTRPEMEAVTGRSIGHALLVRMERDGEIERAGIRETHEGRPCILWRLLRWAPPRTPSSPSCARGGR